MREFWVASGHHLAQLTRNGWLGVTDALLLAWLARPEILPPTEACAGERALHARLVRDPRAAVAPDEIARLADADARENWMFLVDFRDRLIAAGTVEGAYLEIVRSAAQVPPVFLDHLAQLVLRNALDGCEDPLVLRAGELFFRPQRASVREGNLMLADAETIETLEEARHEAPLTAMFGAESLDVMSAGNAWTYWSRSDAHAMILNLGGDPAARAGLAQAIAAFVRHLLGIAVTVTPHVALRDVDLRWYVGLDAQASAIGNALWRGENAPAGLDRLIGIFALEMPLDMPEGARVDPRAAGHPVHLLMAVTPDGTLRLKPQNLIAGLPLVEMA